MPDGTTRRRVLAGASSLALSAIAGCGWIERDERRSFERAVDAGAAESLAIESDTGDVTVRGHDGDAVHVHGEKHAASEDAIDALSLTTQREDDRLVLRTERGDGPDPLGWWRAPTLDLEVQVPTGLRVGRAATDAGDLEVQHVTGPLAVAADAGDVYVANVEGRVEASAKTGDVTIRNVGGEISATVDTGDVSVDGAIDAVQTDTGQIEATVRALAADPSIRADSGDVSLAVASSLDVTVAAEIDAGDLDVQDDDLEVGEAGGVKRIVLGNGARRLVVSVDAGDVSITALH
jgi:DUF4097 and DUF4098 domain-containing protein YvlB